ncbi:hypothetical protein BDR26DRAFT_938016 [Obelidium mucronatum]|nr:hypothetical protein BDR26DRAFT_938016 [Obelidium mucronatum]
MSKLEVLLSAILCKALNKPHDKEESLTNSESMADNEDENLKLTNEINLPADAHQKPPIHFDVSDNALDTGNGSGDLEACNSGDDEDNNSQVPYDEESDLEAGNPDKVAEDVQVNETMDTVLGGPKYSK